MDWKRLSGMALVLTLGLGACGDGTAPIEDFDPEVPAAEMAAAESAFDTDVFRSLEAMGGSFGQVAAAPAFAAELLTTSHRLATRSLDRRLADASEGAERLLASSMAIVIPETFRGRTYAYSPQSGWFIDETRTDGPANGIRFVLYAINPITEEIAEPLNEIGHADVLDESGDTTLQVRLIVVSVGTEFVNYTVSAGGPLNAITFEIDGFVTDGETRVNVNLSAGFSANIGGAEVTLNYAIDVPSRGFELTADISLVSNAETQQVTLTVDVQFSIDGYNVQAVGSFTEGEESGNVQLLVNGELFASITVNGTTITVVDASGGQLSAADAQAVRDIVDFIEDVFDSFEDFFNPVEWLFETA